MSDANCDTYTFVWSSYSGSEFTGYNCMLHQLGPAADLPPNFGAPVKSIFTAKSECGCIRVRKKA